MSGLSLPASPLPRIVVIGGGFGGITMARRLQGKPFQVVLLDRHNYHTFQPLLYQVATGGLEADSIAYPIRKIFPRHRNILFRMAEVREIDTQQRHIVTGQGDLAYDHLVIATGSTTNFFGMDDVAQRAMTLKSVTDALDLRSLLLQNFEKATATAGEPEGLLNMVVVGGGPTGVEVAGALAEFRNHVVSHDYPEINKDKIHIRLVEAADRLLGTFKNESSEASRSYLERLGVQVDLQTTLKSYDGSIAVLGDGTRVPSACVIWSAGVRGVCPSGLKDQVMGKGSRIRVDTFHRIEGYDREYAIGDVALMAGEASYPNGHPMVAQVAIQQAKNLAHNLACASRCPPRPFAYRDLGSMATVGRNKAVAEFSRIRLRGGMAWLVWMAVHLMSLVGYRNRIIVLVNWIWSYISYDRAIRLIIRPFAHKTK